MRTAVVSMQAKWMYCRARVNISVLATCTLTHCHPNKEHPESLECTDADQNKSRLQKLTKGTRNSDIDFVALACAGQDDRAKQACAQSCRPRPTRVAPVKAAMEGSGTRLKLINHCVMGAKRVDPFQQLSAQPHPLELLSQEAA